MIDGQEAVDGRWTSPRLAVAEQLDGHIVLAPPTLKTLVDLSDVTDVDSALRAVAGRPPRTYAPHVFIEAGQRFVLLPGDELYPAPPDVALPPPTRFRFDGTRWQAV